jgi:ASC-1-like (ASCH) protein
MYVAIQNNKLYYTNLKSKLYCENIKTGKKKVLSKVSANTTVAGSVGKYLILDEEKLVKETTKKQVWKRTVWLYTTSGKKVKTLYSQKSTYKK